MNRRTINPPWLGLAFRTQTIEFCRPAIRFSTSTPFRSLENSEHHKPKGFWESKDNQRALFEDIGKRLNLSSLDDWNSVKTSQVNELGGKYVISLYPSFSHALQSIFPEHNWNSSKRPHRPNNFWKSTVNQRQFLDDLIKELKFKSPLELVSVTSRQLRSYGGRNLLRYYPSFHQALVTLYPEHQWTRFIPHQVSSSFLESLDNQRTLLEYIGKKFGVNCLDDWLKVSSKNFRANGGHALLQKYSSFIELLMTLYPDHNWKTLIESQQKASGYWDNLSNIQEFMRQAEEKLFIVRPEDWYRVSTKQFSDIKGGVSLIQKYGSLKNLLLIYHPQISWEQKKFNFPGKRATQRLIFFHLRKIFPSDFEIIEEYLHEELTRSSGVATEFDLFIPKLNLAIEYHGEHHFMDIPAHGSLEQHQLRDREKRQLCERNGLTLVTIPYFKWDGTTEGLRSLLPKITETEKLKE